MSLAFVRSRIIPGLFLAGMFFHPVHLRAVVSAAGCSDAAIQGAINLVPDGETIQVPAGTCTWTTNVTVTKGIKLQGAGPDKTIIIMGGNRLILQTSSAKPAVSVSGFTFRNTDGSRSFEIDGTAKNWRVYNNVFDVNNNRGGYVLRVGPGHCNSDMFNYGVIDSNKFINGNYTTFLYVEWPRGDLDKVACGDAIWSMPAERGTAQAVYIEDNEFSNSGSPSQLIDSRWGAKYVIRYNTIENPWISTHSGCTNQGRDPVWTEIYKNTFKQSGEPYPGSQVEMRSVSGVWFGNRSSSTIAFRVTVDHERSYRTDCAGDYKGLCDGTRPFDQNNSGNHGWRCLGQPGWGQPELSDMSAATFVGAFAWENRNANALVNLAIANNNGYTAEHLQFGRELFNQENMGIGPIENRPATCSAGTPRSVYVSTNENSQGAKIYICAATNTWVRHWEPYTYPHPLRAATGGKPAPPTNLAAMSF